MINFENGNTVTNFYILKTRICNCGPVAMVPWLRAFDVLVEGPGMIAISRMVAHSHL